jgi:hypothetical protein
MANQPEYGHRQSRISLQKVMTAAVLAAASLVILFPLLIRAKGSYQSAACARNLGHIGQAIALYSSAHDDRFPAAIDASDKFVPGLWDAQSARGKLIAKMPLLNVALRPYVKDPSVFHCPVDNGGQVMENSFFTNPTAFPCSKSMFGTYGSSYLFRTEIVFKSLSRKGYWPPSDVAMLFDGFGHWHAGTDPLTVNTNPVIAENLVQSFRYNALFGDTHVRSLSYSELQDTWSRPL